MNESSAGALDGSRLIVLRDLYRLTQIDLAAQLGVTQGFISHIETGARPMPTQVAIQASNVFGIPPKFFEVTSSAHLHSGFHTFRKTARSGVRDERRIQALFDEASRLFWNVSNSSGYRPLQFAKTAASDPEIAAEAVRAADGLGPTDPVRNVTRLIERQGVGVVSKLDDESRDVSDHKGISRPSRFNDRPLIAIVRDLPGVVQRLTLAHELGHLYFDGGLSKPIGSTRSPEERRAFRFAGALLIPERVMRKRVTETLTLHGYLPIKADYGMSVAAIVRRAYDLGLIQADRYRSLMIQHSSQGWRTHEPVEVTTEEPRLLAQACVKVYGRDPVSSVSHEVGIAPAMIRQWLMQPENLESGNIAEVISLSQRRQQPIKGNRPQKHVLGPHSGGRES